MASTVFSLCSKTYSATRNWLRSVDTQGGAFSSTSWLSQNVRATIWDFSPICFDQTFLKSLVSGQLLNITTRVLPTFYRGSDKSEKMRRDQSALESSIRDAVPDLTQAIIDSGFHVLGQFLSEEMDSTDVVPSKTGIDNGNPPVPPGLLARRARGKSEDAKEIT